MVDRQDEEEDMLEEATLQLENLRRDADLLDGSQEGEGPHDDELERQQRERVAISETRRLQEEETGLQRAEIEARKQQEVETMRQWAVDEARQAEEEAGRQQEEASRLSQEVQEDVSPSGAFRGGRQPAPPPGSGLAALLSSNPLLRNTLSRAVGSREERLGEETPRRPAPIAAPRTIRFSESSRTTGELAAAALKRKVADLDRNLSNLHVTTVDEFCRSPQDQGQLQHIRVRVTQLKESTSALLAETAHLQTLPQPSPSLRDLDAKLQSATGTVSSLEMLLEREQLPANSHPSAGHRPPATSTFQQEPGSHIYTSPQHRQGQAYLP
jgi:hypothetical protein